MITLSTSIRNQRGLAVGTAFTPRLTPIDRLSDTHPMRSTQEEVESIEQAINDTKIALTALAETEPIFEAHIEIADDPELKERIDSYINSGLCAHKALDKACSEVCELFESIDDEYLRERVVDVRDVCRRIKRTLLG